MSKQAAAELQEFLDENSGGTQYDSVIELNGWRRRIDCNPRTGDIRKSLSNSCLYLEEHPELREKIQFSEFSCQPVITAELPWMDKKRIGTHWKDADDKALSVWLERNSCPNSKTDIPDAIEVVSRQNSFHPVRDYLGSLKWDGTQRVEAWLQTYLGVEANPYTMAVGKMWLISAVARIYKPGCKADCMLIFESGQGIKKSTTLEILGGEWFTDELHLIGSKDAAQQLQGVWIIEMSELDSMSRASVGAVKAFLSRHTDRFRPPYGRRPDDFPRQCIFGGTCNGDDYLVDDTGSRRFWPVEATNQDLDQLRVDRDQIWAEAVMLYQAGEKWWIDHYLPEDAEIFKLHGDVVKTKQVQDVWERLVLKVATEMLSPVHIDAIMDKMGIDVVQQSGFSSKRVGGILRRAGYKGRRGTGGAYEFHRPIPENLFKNEVI